LAGKQKEKVEAFFPLNRWVRNQRRGSILIKIELQYQINAREENPRKMLKKISR
jgi:hypothetical protein